MADVPGYYRPVWFHPGGIANVLSVVNMIKNTTLSVTAVVASPTEIIPVLNSLERFKIWLVAPNLKIFFVALPATFSQSAPHNGRTPLTPTLYLVEMSHL
jgi:hypothetical protein